ncbi:hypothetical protein [Paraburkholderia gardini]|uniref:hypothetical protein n=1 Tax=Paraburkholderia gardini TaxID=2823469 RepID=UPI001E0B411A|nr:hypothetical protein [Paraburkholderia gardini]CAG4914125.1 hypothetical protein R69919_04169 [Paraburkholderia gardini]
MDALDRLVPYYRAFNRLPFVVRRILLVMTFLGSFVVGVKLFPHFENLGLMFLMIAWFGLVWSTGLWRLWKPLAIILAIWLRMNY